MGIDQLKIPPNPVATKPTTRQAPLMAEDNTPKTGKSPRTPRDTPSTPGRSAGRPHAHSAPPFARDELSAALEDPALYDATRAAVGTVLTRAADLLASGALAGLGSSPGAVSAASQILRGILTSARGLLGSAAETVHKLMPLGVRLAENVMTVPEWRRVEARAKFLAHRVVWCAMEELRLAPEQRAARALLRRLRAAPARLWADLTLAEAAEELAERRLRREAEDPAAAAEEALLRAYRAAVRAQQAEPVPAVPLPPAEGFSVPAGEAVVHDVVRSWRYAVRWKYCVDFLRTEEEPLLTRHVYQARFSIPEPHQPIPKAVAYVFFTLIVSKVRAPSQPIQVYYMMETSRMRHVPGKTIFQEKWLVDIVNAKLQFWREIKF